MRMGRDREIADVVNHLRAAQVANVFSGNHSMTRVYPEMMQNWSRSRIRSERDRVRRDLSDGVNRFLRQNFPGLKLERLAEFYLPIFEKGSMSIPLSEFNEIVGVSGNAGVFKSQPLHATVRISKTWGLLVECPEHHLMQDLAVAYNGVLETKEKLSQWERQNRHRLRANRAEIASLQRYAKTFRRMCLLACFNLIEAYVNGLAWGYAAGNDTVCLSRNDREMIEEGKGSIVRRIQRVPEIISGKRSLLDESIPPLSTFQSVIKPYRDSIVLASPFQVPEKFGGYNKLEKIYAVNDRTVGEAIRTTEHIVSKIHKAVDGEGDLPNWFLQRGDNGKYVFSQ